MKFSFILFYKYVFILITCRISLQIFDGDGLPNQICSQCMLQISKSYTFKQLCQKSDITLRNYIDEKNSMMLITSENTKNDEVDSTFSKDDNSYAKYETDLNNSFEKLDNGLINENITYGNEVERNDGNLLIVEIYQCSECPASFNLKVDLEVHKLQMHTVTNNENMPSESVTEVLHTCEVCNKEFKGIVE